MIPKTIHYCWFGGKEKPKLAQKCIRSWKKYCPDYKIIEWNENNFDVHQNDYTSFLYENKKYAFLSDYVRLKVVFDQGGVYFDTDVEVIKSIDNFLKYEAFYGFENDQYVASGLGFGAEKGHITLAKMLEIYDNTQPNDGYSDHIGIVESVGGGKIVTIEGNYSDAVKRRVLSVGDGNIRGYARPRYGKASVKPVKDSNDTQSTNSIPTPTNTLESPSKTPKWVGKVTCNGLNVRTWAGIENPNIKSYPILNYGNLVDVCDTVEDKDGFDWYYVRIAGKYYGFVHSAYIARA